MATSSLRMRLESLLRTAPWLVQEWAGNSEFIELASDIVVEQLAVRGKKYDFVAATSFEAVPIVDVVSKMTSIPVMLLDLGRVGWDGSVFRRESDRGRTLILVEPVFDTKRRVEHALNLLWIGRYEVEVFAIVDLDPQEMSFHEYELVSAVHGPSSGWDKAA